VAAILAVLFALLLPTLGRMRLSGQKAASTHNLRQLAVATLAYCADQEGFFRLYEREVLPALERIRPRRAA